MTDFLTYIATWSVLKWVLLVLIAGFIGQFGKMLAEAIIARVRLNRSGRAGVEDKSLRQGSSAPPVVSSRKPPAPPAVTGDIPDKKALKIAAKARKKEAKKRE